MTGLAFAAGVRARRAGLAAILLSAALAPAAALADPATETALRMFVSAIDASPDWQAAYAGLASDSTGAGVLSGLKVESTVPGMTIAVDTLSVTKGTAGSDGRYGATKIVAGNITISAGPLNVTLANVALDDFAVPAGIAFSFDPSKPFSSIAHAYGALAKAHLGQARVASVAVAETLAGTTSRVTYSAVTLTRLDAGRIATLSAGPLLTESPIPDTLNTKPLVTISVARADAKDLDLGAILRVYDPPQPGGARTWAPAIANTTYRDASIVVPGITIKLGTIAMDDLRVRPPDRNLADDIDKSISDPFEQNVGGDPAGMLNLLSAYSVGKLSAGPIDVTATGLDTVHLDAMSIANMSLDGIGEFALSGFNVGVKDIASIKAGRVAIGGMTFPKSDVLAEGLRTAFAGGDVDVSSITPTVGFVELGTVDLNVTGFPSTHLAKMRFDLANPIGNVPTSVKVDIAGADLDAALMPGIVREQLAHFGYQRVKTDVAGRIDWNEAKKTTTVSGLKLTVKDVGTLGVDAVLAGPSRADFEQLGSLTALEGFTDKLSLISGTVSFKDDSIAARVLADQAKQVNVDLDKFRNQIVFGLPFMLLPVGTADFQRKAAPVFQDFIRSPGTVTFSAAPAMPIGLPAIIAAAKSSGVFSLPTTLNLTVTGIPGPKPPTTPTPAPAPAIAPPAPPAGGDIRGTLQPPK